MPLFYTLATYHTPLEVWINFQNLMPSAFNVMRYTWEFLMWRFGWCDLTLSLIPVSTSAFVELLLLCLPAWQWLPPHSVMTSETPPDPRCEFHFPCYCFLFLCCAFICVGQFSLSGTRICKTSHGLSPVDKEATKPRALLSVCESSDITGHKRTSVVVVSGFCCVCTLHNHLLLIYPQQLKRQWCSWGTGVS